jgi:EAL domain-containing protein (putative c-di-GMP-specific phosphodiesterase class I)
LPVQFRGADLCKIVESALAKFGLEAVRLELEITESFLFQDDETSPGILEKLRALGMQIVLDDFGIGFSSLAYPLRYPFNKIKIDRSFIVGRPDREDARTLTRAIIGIGSGHGMSVAAEGVETEEQFAALLVMGCNEIQAI